MFQFPAIATLGELRTAIQQRFHELASDGVERHRHGLYSKSVALANDMRSHIDLEYKPIPPADEMGHLSKEEIELLNRSWLYRYRPNESPKIREYRLSIWEPVTASLMSKPLIFLSRLFNKKLTRIMYPPILPARTSGRDIKSYLGQISFMDWLKTRFLKFGIIDPNGFVTIRTSQPDSVLMPDQLPEPKLYCIPSANILQFSDNYLVSISTDKSEVIIAESINGKHKTEFSGWVFFLYLPDATFRIFQIGKKKENKFAAELWNLHQAGQPAFIQAGGDLAPFKEQVESIGERPYFQSFLQPALPHLNELASLHSNQQAAYITRIYLEKYQKAVDCPRCKGKGTIPLAGINHPKLANQECPNCRGTKYVAANSILDTFSIRGLKVNEEIKPPAGYIDVPIDIVDAVDSKIKQLRFQVLSSIHMESLEQENKVTTAVGLEKEREGLYTLLEGISMNTFDRVGQYCLDMVNFIRYGALLNESDIMGNRPIIVGPTNFDIRTLGDSIAEHKELSGASLPRSMRVASVLRIAAQSYGETTEVYKAIRAEVIADPLAGMTDDEILVARQTDAKNITSLDLFRHYNAGHIIHLLTLSDPDFLLSDDQEIIRRFNELSESMFDERQGPEQPPLPPIQTGQLV